MPCELQNDVTAYVDDALPPKRRDALRAHLQGCAECRGLERRLRQSLAALARLAAPVPSRTPEEAWRALSARLDAEPPTFRERWRGMRALWLVGPALAGAAAAVLLVTRAPSRDPLPAELLSASDLEVVGELEMLDHLEVLGLSSAEDFELVAALHEEEGR